MIKICTKCGQKKDLEKDFYPRNSNSSNKMSKCKDCVGLWNTCAEKRLIFRDYYYRNREKILERSKKYYKNNRDKILAYSKEYSKKHTEKNRNYCKKYYAKIRERKPIKSNEFIEKKLDKKEAPIGYKQCGKCGQVKLLDEFLKQVGSLDGYFHYCKLCVNIDMDVKPKGRRYIFDGI